MFIQVVPPRSISILVSAMDKYLWVSLEIFAIGFQLVCQKIFPLFVQTRSETDNE